MFFEEYAAASLINTHWHSFLSFHSFIHIFLVMWLNGILAILSIPKSTFASGLHKGVDCLLQVTPFSGNDVALHPGLDPNHDSHNLEHLVAGLDKVLHYSQEGNRRKFDEV
jgi:hypothetical protein